MIGERINSRLRALGISQAELARRVGLHSTTINGMIKGGQVSSTRLHEIARELQTTPEYLKAETDDPSIDAADLALDSHDREVLELINSLEPENRKALMQILRTMAHSARSPGIQSPKRAKFVGPTEVQLAIKPSVRA